MRLSLCNEVLRPMPLARQAAFACVVGYDGLEIAPFTLDDEPHLMSHTAMLECRRAVEDHGVVVTGLHWLLLTPKGLSILAEDQPTRDKTRDVLLGLLDLCATLGGKTMVHGSPAQRSPSPGQSPERCFDLARSFFAALAPEAGARGITYCVEPLARAETLFLNTVAEAGKLVEAVGHPAFKTMIDTSAASQTEAASVADVVRAWAPTGILGHVQFNDTNRRGPGEGSDCFAPIVAALKETGYAGDIAVEPFVYIPDGPTCAARAAGYVRGLLEAAT